MISTASRRSNATAPRPSQIRRYGEVNGTTAEITLIEAYGSVTVVTTCSPVKVTASSDTFLCSATVTNLGQAGRANRTDVSTPSTTLAVSRTSAASPVARVAYHSGLVAVATAAAGMALRTRRW